VIWLILLIAVVLAPSVFLAVFGDRKER